MLKLFTQTVDPHKRPKGPEDIVYTRFRDNRKRPRTQVEKPQRTMPDTEPARQPVQARATAPGTDDASQLYAHAAVPVGILRKALPLRFARLAASNDEFVFH